MTSNIHKYNIGTQFVVEATRAIETFIAGQKEDTIRIALSGGSSPIAVYEKLAESKLIDWSKVEIYQVDERFVPSDDVESNKKMIETHLLSKIENLKAFYAFNTSKSLEEAVTSYGERIKKLTTPLFDLVILGMGTDGHTASLFPHGPELDELETMALDSISPNGVAERLSLSFPALMNCQKIVFLVRGAEKKEMIEELLNGDKMEYEVPAKIAFEHQNVELYYDYSTT